MDYGSYLFASASLYLRKKLNSLLISCLRCIIGALRSAPNHCIEVECACPPFELRSKFILKNLTSSLFSLHLNIFNSWKYRNLFLSSPPSLLHSHPFNFMCINNHFFACKSLTLLFQHYL